MAEPILIDANLREPAPAVTGAPGSLRAAVNDALGTEFPRHAARFVAADEWRTRSAIDLLVSAILRRLARRSATPDGAARVFAELGSPRIDSDLLATVDRLLAGEPGGQGERLSAGEQAAQALFGRWTGALVLQVESATGLSVEAVWQLLGLTTPLVYAALRDHTRERGLDAEALQNRLADEDAADRSIYRRPSHGAVAAATEGALRVARAALARAGEEVARLDRRTLVLGGLVAVIAVAAASFWGGGADPTNAGASTGGSGASRPVGFADGPESGATRSAGANGLRAFLSGDTSGVEHVLALDGVQFEPASATLKFGSIAPLAQLAGVLTDFPEARLVIEVRADGMADAAQDQTLAERRALAVRAALAAFGVRPSRMSHAGIGGADPPGSRIEARVTKG